MFERQSALAGTLVSGDRDGADGQRLLRIGEVRGWGLVQITSFAATLPELKTAARSALNAELPMRVGEVVNVNGLRLLRTGSEQYWIIMLEGDDRSRTLQDAVPPDIGAVTLLSHSRTCIFIEGLVARETLAKGIALDFYSDAFRLGHFALTGLHHTPILIHRSGENRYELYAMRTFALSVWEFLTDAALPFGYEVTHSG